MIFWAVNGLDRDWDRRVWRTVAKSMSAGRRRHARSVADWAARLARRHKEDPRRARRAGLLHDLAKEWSPARLWRYVRQWRVPVPAMDDLRRRRLHQVLHGYVARHRARALGWETDPATLNAMARHTLGHPRMTRLDKILYVADYSSRDRRYPEARWVRRAARRDLNRAVRLVTALKLREVIGRGEFLHPVTVALWNSRHDR